MVACYAEHRVSTEPGRADRRVTLRLVTRTLPYYWAYIELMAYLGDNGAITWTEPEFEQKRWPPGNSPRKIVPLCNAINSESKSLLRRTASRTAAMLFSPSIMLRRSIYSGTEGDLLPAEANAAKAGDPGTIVGVPALQGVSSNDTGSFQRSQVWLRINTHRDGYARAELRVVGKSSVSTRSAGVPRAWSNGYRDHRSRAPGQGFEKRSRTDGSPRLKLRSASSRSTSASRRRTASFGTSKRSANGGDAACTRDYSRASCARRDSRIIDSESLPRRRTSHPPGASTRPASTSSATSPSRSRGTQASCPGGTQIERFSVQHCWVCPSSTAPRELACRCAGAASWPRCSKELRQRAGRVPRCPAVLAPAARRPFAAQSRQHHSSPRQAAGPFARQLRQLPSPRTRRIRRANRRSRKV
jgi:hypothetical protein